MLLFASLGIPALAVLFLLSPFSRFLFIAAQVYVWLLQDVERHDSVVLRHVGLFRSCHHELRLES